MRICAIAAMSENRVIGLDGKIPWCCPDDLIFFKETTQRHPVIMGRKKYESLPDRFRPLPNRLNIVLTRDRNILRGRSQSEDVDGTVWVENPAEAMNVAREQSISETSKGEVEDVFVIGGSEVYRMFMPCTSRLYFTVIKENHQGDTYFPSWPNHWEKTVLVDHEGDHKNPAYRRELWVPPRS